VSISNIEILLPRNEPKELKDIDRLGGDVISRIDLSNFTLLPAKSNTKLLKHLAFLFDIDIEALSESEQRNLVEKAYDIHRHIGTNRAIIKALEVLDKQIEIIEWYETDDELPPYTFGIKLDKQDDRGVEFLIDYISRFKNERSRLKKLTDGRCKSKAKYDNSRYEDSLFSDVEGIVIDGVRVCFKSNIDKSLAVDYKASTYAIFHEAKIAYFFGNRYDNFRYGEKSSLFSVTSSTLKNIDKEMHIKRVWLGAWVGSVRDVYRPSFVSAIHIDKESEFELSVSSLIEAFSNRESVLEAKISTQNKIDKEFRLQRQWQGAWVGSVRDAYAVAIL